MKKLQNANPIRKRGVVWLFYFIPILVFNSIETESYIETKYWLFGILPLPKTVLYFSQQEKIRQ